MEAILLRVHIVRDADLLLLFSQLVGVYFKNVVEAVMRAVFPASDDRSVDQLLVLQNRLEINGFPA
ncbi:hypothetical protein D3C87_1923100 [compost metagenome]